MEKSLIAIRFTRFKGQLTGGEPLSAESLKVWLVVACACGFLAFFVHKPSTDHVSTGTRDEPLATSIPEGFTLQGIEVANYETLDQSIGTHGVVDIYTVPENPLEKVRRLISAARVVRAANSPRHYNVLLPADEAGILASHRGPFGLTVRNPSESGTIIEKAKKVKPRRAIVYELED